MRLCTPVTVDGQLRQYGGQQFKSLVFSPQLRTPLAIGVFCIVSTQAPVMSAITILIKMCRQLSACHKPLQNVIFILLYIANIIVYSETSQIQFPLIIII